MEYVYDHSKSTAETKNKNFSRQGLFIGRTNYKSYKRSVGGYTYETLLIKKDLVLLLCLASRHKNNEEVIHRIMQLPYEVGHNVVH